jgi:hypothetical protein
VDDEKNTYRVGYRKPPQGTQFQKGHSGNPKGRPRRSKSVSSLVREGLFELVEVRENGRCKKISKLSVALTQLFNRAAGGDLRAIEQVLKIPGVQKELAELRKPTRLTPEVLERAKLLVRGSLEDGHQPDLWESLRDLQAVRDSLYD